MKDVLRIKRVCALLIYTVGVWDSEDYDYEEFLLNALSETMLRDVEIKMGEAIDITE